MALSPLKEEALDHGVSGIGLSENQSHLIINIQLQWAAHQDTKYTF